MKSGKTIIRLMALMGLMGIIGCSEDSEGNLGSSPIEIMGFMADYQEVEGTTRAWTPPTGFAVQEGAEQGIGYCFTQDGVNPADLQGAFFRSGSGWRSTVDIAENMNAGTYYLYGYTPSSGVSCTITDLDGNNTKFSEGAILTLVDLPSATFSEVSVVVGAKNGKNSYQENEDYSVTGLQPGDFEYIAYAGESGGTASNYVFLLFDHLYAALRINIKVGSEYDKLRTINLKGLKISTSGLGGATKSKVKAIITLEKTTDGSDPIRDIQFEQTGTAVGGGSMSVPSGDGTLLTNSYKTFQGQFMPIDVTTLIVTSTYDVYDKNGNLIRSNCTAENTIPLSLFPHQDQFSRGTRYTVNMTVEPTYLYMLSEPDLNNPSIVLN